jgi:Spy/CpxP family protein refolding chaperone
MGPRGGGLWFNPASNAEARLAYLKSELKITTDQEAAWNAYGAAVKQQAADMQAFRTAMFNTQTPQDRVTLHANHAKQRATGFENLDKGLRELYAVLTPDQKAQADLHLGRMRFGQAGPRGHW